MKKNKEPIKKKYTIPEIIVAFVALIGAVTGIWSSYNISGFNEFKKPYIQREQISASYNSQINSAKARNDEKEVIRLRIELEIYEEQWRKSIIVSAAVKPIENLIVPKLTKSEIKSIHDFLSEDLGKYAISLSPKTAAAAYIAINDYKSAIENLNTITWGSDNWYITDSNAWALKAVSFSGLELQTDDISLKEKYSNLAIDSYYKASNLGEIKQRIGTFMVNKNLEKAKLYRTILKELKEGHL